MKSKSSYYERNRDKVLARVKDRYQKKKADIKAYSRKYYKENREEILKTYKTEEYLSKARKRSREYYNKNKEKIHKKTRKLRATEKHKEEQKRYQKEYALKNSDKLRAIKSKYKYSKKQACPKWLTDKQWNKIDSIYRNCESKSLKTGRLYHVDHIVPLQGKNVCGLHVPWNLRIILAKTNIKKSNKF